MCVGGRCGASVKCVRLNIIVDSIDRKECFDENEVWDLKTGVFDEGNPNLPDVFLIEPTFHLI